MCLREKWQASKCLLKETNRSISEQERMGPSNVPFFSFRCCKCVKMCCKKIWFALRSSRFTHHPGHPTESSREGRSFWMSSLSPWVYLLTSGCQWCFTTSTTYSNTAHWLFPQLVVFIPTILSSYKISLLWAKLIQRNSFFSFKIKLLSSIIHFYLPSSLNNNYEVEFFVKVSY